MLRKTAEDHRTDAGELPAGTYRINRANSTISITTRHLFGLGKVEGTFELRGGQIDVAHPIEQSTATAVVGADSFTTGNSRRDNDVTSAKFVDAAAYPDITFVSDRLQYVDGSLIVYGSLSAHGIRSPIELRIDQISSHDGEVTLSAEARIDRYDFGVTAAKGMAARHLDLHLQVTARS